MHMLEDVPHTLVEVTSVCFGEVSPKDILKDLVLHDVVAGVAWPMH